MRASYFAALAAFGLSACAGSVQQASTQQASTQQASTGSAMSPHAAGRGADVAANETMTQGGVTWTNAGALTSPNSLPAGFVDAPTPGPTTTYTQGQPIWIGGGERETSNGLPTGFADEPAQSGVSVTFARPNAMPPAPTQSAQAPLPATNAQN